MDNRRSEPRYLVNEDALVWDLHRMKAGYGVATIVDVSRSGMRLESDRRLVQGSHVAVDFRGMIICGSVQYCTSSGKQFALGIHISDLLDPIVGEAAEHPADEKVELEAVTAWE